MSNLVFNLTLTKEQYDLVLGALTCANRLKDDCWTFEEALESISAPARKYSNLKFDLVMGRCDYGKC